MNGNGQHMSAVRPSDGSADVRDSDQSPECDSRSDTFDALAAVVRSSPRGLRRRLIASDVLAIVIGAVLATAIQQRIRPVDGNVLSAEIVLAVIGVPVWVLMMGINHLFLARAISQVGDEFRCLVKSGLMAVSFLVAVSFLAKYGALSRLWVALLFVCVTASLAMSRMIARRVFTRLRREGRISRPVVIVGTGIDALSLFHATQRRPDLGYEVVGFTGDETRPAGRGERARRGRGHARRRPQDGSDRCDLVGRLARSGGGEPAHADPHRQRLPRDVVVVAARHRHLADAGPGDRRSSDDLRRADESIAGTAVPEAHVRRHDRGHRTGADAADHVGGGDGDPDSSRAVRWCTSRFVSARTASCSRC